MSEQICVICNKGATTTKRLANYPDMVKQLVSCCQERLNLGDSSIKQLADHLTSLDESELRLVHYHSECRKPIVNMRHIERLKSKRDRSESPICKGPGRPCRPSTSMDSGRPKRTKTTPKVKECLFSTCTFCPNDDTEVFCVSSDSMGEKLLQIKLNTKNDNVRTCVANLQDPGDASALEKYYHIRCLRSAQRTFTTEDISESTLIRYACDEQLLLAVQNTLTADDATMNMAAINDAYLSILRRFHVEINATENYRKHLRKLISEQLPNVQFVKSLRKNESDNLVIQTAVSKAIDLRLAMLGDGETISYMAKISNILRDEMIQHRNWVFNGNFENFENPPLLQFFLSHLLFGRHVHKVSGKRNDEVDKTVDTACQFLIQNTRSDRQVKHQSKGNEAFRQTVQTPLSVGLPLCIHARVRDKSLINNLTDVYIGCDYQRIIQIEKRIEQGVLERINESGGFCLPDFVKKGVNIWFAIDNIDLIEDTPTGQKTFHGTVVVINQRAEDGEAINGPLVIPEKLPPAPLAFKIKYMQEPVIKKKPIRFGTFQLEKRKILLSTNYTRIWALANYLGADDICEKNANDPSVEEIQQEDISEQPDQAEAPGEDGPSVEEIQQVNISEQPDQAEDPGGDGDQYTPSAESQILSIQKHTLKTKKLAKEAVMPTWAATKSLLLSQSSLRQCQTNTEVIAPLFKTTPTDYATLYTALMLTQGISAFVVGPERKTLITLDLDLYYRAIHIQQSVCNSNWILRPGGLHIAFAALHALGKTIDASGIDTCAIESGTYTAAALRGIYGGKAYKRGIEYHITNSLAILMMKFDDISDSLPPGPLRAQCSALKNALHQRSPAMVGEYNKLQSAYLENVKPLEEEKNLGELAQFLMQYLEQVESLMQLISACRSGDWEGYLAALENNIKYFFARDLLNYARLMPLHLAQMNALEQDDPVTWDALKSGDFVVAKSEIPFTQLFTDQTLEQEIKMLKRHGGMIGLSQDEAALDRLVTITPHLTHLVRQFLNAFPKASRSTDRSEHYQLSGSVAIRSRDNAVKLRQSIELHCEGNPFTKKTPLKNIVSSALVPDGAKNDILHYQEKGQTRLQEFIQDRLLSSSKLSIWDHMKKLKLKAFLNWMEKTKIRVGDKVIKLREERQLLGRFLIIQKSRPELVPKLEKAIGEYEMSMVPRSLCAVDGSLYIPADKASLMHAIEGAEAQTMPSATQPQTQPSKVIIIDAMAVLQSMTKTPTTQKLSDLQEAFIKRIEFMMVGYSEGHVVFDRYQDQSLKSKTRQKRATTSTEYKVHSQMKLAMSLKELLSSSKTKSSLTAIFAEALLQHFSSKNNFKLVVVYGTKIKSYNSEDHHTHEEADTLIPHQVLASLAEHDWHEVCVWSPDTDVLTMLLDLASRGRLRFETRLKFLTGKATKYREIDVMERVHAIGILKSQGLIGLHNFTGADWGGKFVGISKKTWVDAYMKLDENDPIITCFRQLGDGIIPSELVDDDLPPQVKDLEKFVCQVYSSTGEIDLPTLRWEMFQSKNMEGEMLPPTRTALLPHITRANYIAMRDKSYMTRSPDLPSIEQSGWRLEKGVYSPVQNLALPAPRAVIELTKCGCKKGCTSKCSCRKNGVPCTPLCKCYGKCCTNVTKDTHDRLDDEDDE